MSNSGELDEINEIKKRSGRPREEVWEYFEEKGERIKGHCGGVCKFCGWEKRLAQPNDMREHLAFYCKEVPYETRKHYLEVIKNYSILSKKQKKKQKINQQPKIYEKFESTKIDSAKIDMANRAIVKFFACCGIPFHIVENPFFIDLLCTLCPGYSPPSRYTLSVSMLNVELAFITGEINDMLNVETNLTLALDGWTSPSGQSLYAFIIITKDRREIVHSIQNLSKESHTGIFLSEKIIEVIENVGGHEKFTGLVSDNASTMVLAKNLVHQKYENIIPIRCISHHINLLTTDICKLEFARSILKKCMKLVRFFKTSHQANYHLKQEINENMIQGGGFKSYCKTRWTTAWDCTASVLKCEIVLKKIADENPEYLNEDIKAIITRQFFMNVEELEKVLKPIKEAVKCLEMKSTTLADCFCQLIKLSFSIKNLPESTSTFRNQCITTFNKRWKQFDFDLYMLAYLLHPQYRGKGFQKTVFRHVVHWAIKNIWLKMGGGSNSTPKLIAQLAAYRERKSPYEDEFVPAYYSVESWWKLIEQNENYIQELALKILSITPTNAGCERVFSVLGWYMNKRRTRLSVERLQGLAKLHAYYVSNTKTELKFAAQNMNDDDIYNAMQNIFSDEIELDEIDEEELENFDEVENIEDEETFDIDNGSDGQFDNNDNEMQIENFFNLVDKELAELLKTQEVQVIIEPIIIDHGEKEFDIDDLLDQELVD